MIAELAALGKSRPWPYHQANEQDAEMQYWVSRLDVQKRVENFWLGQLEALLARHWPKLTRSIGLNSVTLLSLVAHYGGPAAMAADPEARQRLARWGRGALRNSTLQEILSSAANSMGARQNRYEVQHAQECATAALAGPCAKREPRVRDWKSWASKTR